MTNDRIIALIREYLDHCAATSAEPTLVGIHWYVDGREKALPLDAEVNAALASYPALRTLTKGGRVVFGASGDRAGVTKAEMQAADAQYREEFAAEYKNLQGRR